MVEITVQLPEVESEGVSAEELVERYIQQAQPLLRKKISELVNQSVQSWTSQEPFRVSFAEFISMGEEEQDELRCAALRRYGNWVETELERRQAIWMLVVGGEVVCCGADLENLPTKSDVYQVGQEKGLAPFVFTKEPLIEEISLPSPTSTWSPLRSDDSYPTIPLLLTRPELPDAALVQQALVLTADLDTGSPAVFLRVRSQRAEGQRAIPCWQLRKFWCYKKRDKSGKTTVRVMSHVA